MTYCPKSKANSRPSKTIEPHPDPRKRGPKRSVSDQHLENQYAQVLRYGIMQTMSGREEPNRATRRRIMALRKKYLSRGLVALATTMQIGGVTLTEQV